MAYIDLTGRHAVSALGAMPATVDSPGVEGGKYLDFVGTGCLEVTGNPDDFKWGTGPACIELIVWQTATLGIYTPGVYPYGNTIFDGGRLFDGVSSTQVPALSGSNAYDPSICPGPPSYARFPLPSPIPGWRKLRYDIDSAGLCTLSVDGAVVGTETAFNVNSVPAGKLLVGGSVYAADDWAYTTCRLAGLRITRASRAGLPFDLSATGAADPLWSQTVLLLADGVAVPGPGDDEAQGLAPAPLLPRGDVRTVFQGGEAADYAIESMLLATDEGLTTAVILSLFTDARARMDDPLPHGDTDRRGYWGDAWPAYPGESMGSRLWLVWPAKQTRENLVRAREYAQEALQWLVTDGIASTVDVQATNPRDGVLALSVRVLKPAGNALALRFESLWSDAT
ncbi:phage GP46 family protein [Zoogloea sp. 1C4]|uniref:phage GP46 family protein n=1 Tax=Zoogloea sp. 1C4 TaxID=2570190 RepID=UPI001D1791EC|nr:phage GP46 family protein [Zoogloea sp. 1C4]